MTKRGANWYIKKFGKSWQSSDEKLIIGLWSNWHSDKFLTRQVVAEVSVTRLEKLFDFGQLFKAFGNN